MVPNTQDAAVCSESEQDNQAAVQVAMDVAQHVAEAGGKDMHIGR